MDRPGFRSCIGAHQPQTGQTSGHFGAGAWRASLGCRQSVRGAGVFRGSLSYAPNALTWIDPFGLKFDWGKYFRKRGGGNPPCNMVNPHAHHIVFKEGRGKMKKVLGESKEILERYNIDWLKGIENLMWAPNKGHSLKNAEKVRDALKAADNKCKGCRPCMVDALQKAGKDIFL